MSSRRALLILLNLLLPLTVTAQQSAPPTNTQSDPDTQTPVQTPPPTATTPTPTASAQPATQPDAAPYTVHVTTRLVVLDMVVVNKKGEVIHDLKRENFHVQEEGTPQTIEHFEASGAHSVPADAKIESTADLDRLAPRAPVDIILLDEFNTRFEDMAFARYSLKKFLEKQPDILPAPTMLIAVDLQDFKVLRDYTRNKNEILNALDHHFVKYPWQAHNNSWVSERYATAFTTLRRVAEAVMGHPGHKNMIWIGRGFPAINWSGIPIDSHNRVQNAVQNCVNLLRDARVTLYTIDPAGVQVNPGDWGTSDPFGGNYEFNRLAKATGGRTLYGRNDVDREITTAVQDGSSFYTLAYRPTESTPDLNKFRHISVTVDRPDLTVITRPGYYLRMKPGVVNPEKPSQRLVSDLNAADSSNMAYDGVRFTVERSASEPEHFIVHVDGHSLVWTAATESEPRRSEIVLIGSTFDKKDKELSREARMIRSNAPASSPATGRILINLKLPFELKVPPHAVRARFTVRVSATSRIGTFDIDLTKPVETPATPAASTSPAQPSGSANQ